MILKRTVIVISSFARLVQQMSFRTSWIMQTVRKAVLHNGSGLGVCYFALQTLQVDYKFNRQNNSTKPMLGEVPKRKI